MYCRKCGAEIKETSKFCDNCGCEVVKVKQVSYAEKYNENKKKSKKQAQSNKEQERMMKHKDEKNPYIAASLFATVVAIVLAMFPWNLLGSGIGTSLPMRIAIVVFALLADYHVTKAKQVNNLIFSKYGFRIKSNVVSMVNVLSVFVTIMGMFAVEIFIKVLKEGDDLFHTLVHIQITMIRQIGNVAFALDTDRIFFVIKGAGGRG